ncbi:MAG: polyhydroxyalkanoic acid system family protein [Parasphingopyxis sp.]|nr:polyhydroxyalkanoic acid system family protein [Sphingomonadales bacterium]
MTEPIVTDIPHQLGREEARRRLDEGVGDIADLVPGGMVKDRRWEGDTLYFVVGALGQTLDCRLEVKDEVVIATMTLPAFLAPFAGKIRKQLQKQGPKLLEKR